MSDALSQIETLLLDVILPNLKGIQTSQTEQRFQTEFLSQNLDDFRDSMQVCFAELRAEIAACRQELEDAMATIRESKTANVDAALPHAKKTLIH